MEVKAIVGIAISSLLGFLFIITCIISAVKAVRDRKRIKDYIKAKEEATRSARLQRQAYINKGNTYDLTEDERHKRLTNPDQFSEINHDTPSNEHKRLRFDYEAETTEIHSALRSCENTSQQSNKHGKAMPVSSARSGINGLPLEPSSNSYSLTSKDTSNIDCEKLPYSGTYRILPENNDDATKKLRRLSYEVAMTDTSWLNQAPPAFAKSDDIMRKYKCSRSSFENGAFNSENMTPKK